jgi:hypothetical protein
MQMPGKTIKKIAILQTMDAIKFTDSSRDRDKDFPYLRIQELSAAGSRRLPAVQTLDSP